MRCTILHLLPVAATLLAGCPGEIKDEDTADTALPETSASGAGAAGEGEIDEINAADVVLTIMASISLGREIQAQATEAEVAPARVGTCEPDVTVDGEQVDIDFTPCDEQGLAGELGCRSDTTQDFVEGYSMNGLTVTGDVSLSHEEGASAITFKTEEGAPIVVSDGTRSLSAAFEITGERDRTEHQSSLWGAAIVTGDDGASVTSADVLLGGASAETVTDSPLVFSTGDLCFCPSAGLLAVGSTYLITSVALDPDSFVDPTDGADDFPEVSVDLPADLASSFQLTTTFSETCGDLELAVTASEVSATITWEQIGAAVCEQSCAGTWDSAALTCVASDSACGRLANKLGRVANSDVEDPTVTLDGAGLADQVLTLVESKVSGARCTPGSRSGFAAGG